MPFLLPALQTAMTEGLHTVPIMADFLEDNFSGLPDVEMYVRRLRDWRNVKLGILIDVVAKFGDRQERSLIRKVVRRAVREKADCHGATRAYIRKSRPVGGKYSQLNHWANGVRIHLETVRMQ